MTKKEIVKTISDQMHVSDETVTQLKVKEIVQRTFDLITETLVTNGRIELRNFGVFEVKTRAARRARNPRTGERVDVAEKSVVTFKPGKEMEVQVRLLDEARETGVPVEELRRQLEEERAAAEAARLAAEAEKAAAKERAEREEKLRGEDEEGAGESGPVVPAAREESDPGEPTRFGADDASDRSVADSDTVADDDESRPTPSIRPAFTEPRLYEPSVAGGRD